MTNTIALIAATTILVVVPGLNLAPIDANNLNVDCN